MIVDSPKAAIYDAHLSAIEKNLNMLYISETVFGLKLDSGSIKKAY